jgi:hypothetical protein
MLSTLCVVFDLEDVKQRADPVEKNLPKLHNGVASGERDKFLEKSAVLEQEQSLIKHCSREHSSANQIKSHSKYVARKTPNRILCQQQRRLIN